MKQVDLTGKVMKNVVTFEKKRIAVWLAKFLGILVVLGASLFASLILFQQELTDRSIWDLLSLFREDREIIAQFWQDTVYTIWIELPHGLLFIMFIILIAIIIVIAGSRKKMKVVKTKVKQLKKYVGRVENT